MGVTINRQNKQSISAHFEALPPLTKQALVKQYPASCQEGVFYNL